jgi:hypothetical protein
MGIQHGELQLNITVQAAVKVEYTRYSALAFCIWLVLWLI